jgi:hypothetical protein
MAEQLRTVAAELTRAIEERHVVRLRYDDDHANRLVLPHVLYRTSAGRECVDAYQVAGPSHSGGLPEWRLFDLAKVRRFEVLPEEFALAPGYNPSGQRYQHRVIARASD